MDGRGRRTTAGPSRRVGKVPTMGLFRRKPSPEQVRARQDEGIAAFWSWWAAEGKTKATATFDGAGEDIQRLGADIARRVDAIDPGLAFETGAGSSARHMCVVTAAGDPDLRDVARRWLSAAPVPDDAFEYADVRQPVREPAGVRIVFGGAEVDLASAVVLAEPSDPDSPATTRVDVSVWHPAFPDLPDDARGQITFLFLDALLGEEVVETAVGAVSWEPVLVPPGVPLTDLPAVIDAVRTQGPEPV